MLCDKQPQRAIWLVDGQDEAAEATRSSGAQLCQVVHSFKLEWESSLASWFDNILYWRSSAAPFLCYTISCQNVFCCGKSIELLVLTTVTLTAAYFIILYMSRNLCWKVNDCINKLCKSVATSQTNYTSCVSVIWKWLSNKWSAGSIGLKVQCCVCVSSVLWQ